MNGKAWEGVGFGLKEGLTSGFTHTGELGSEMLSILEVHVALLYDCLRHVQKTPNKGGRPRILREH
jgi:hypothetical protein